jgi:hypothetical protein
MKKLIILISVFLFGNAIKAQNITSIILGTTFSYQQISVNEYHFTFQTIFSMGSGSNCPPLINPTFTIIDDTLYVKGYYDITGVWPTFGGGRSDTVIYNNSLPSNVIHIKMTTNAIGYNNTPPYNPPTQTYEDIYFHIFDINLSNTQFDNSYSHIFPNPTQGLIAVSNDINYEAIEVVNHLGQLVKRFDRNKSGNYDLNSITNGLYYLVYYNATNEKVGTTKLIKSN